MKRILLLLLPFLWGATAWAQMPKATLNDIHGNAVAIDTIGANGQPVIVDFWATTCKPCLRELAAIADVYEDWQAETGVRLVAISTDPAQNTHKVKPLADENGWEWDVLLDPNSTVAQALGVKFNPAVIIVDGSGNIVYRHTGYTDGAENELIEVVKKLKQ